MLCALLSAGDLDLETLTLLDHRLRVPLAVLRRGEEGSLEGITS